jgi:hypothetical protein
MKQLHPVYPHHNIQPNLKQFSTVRLVTVCTYNVCGDGVVVTALISYLTVPTSNLCPDSKQANLKFRGYVVSFKADKGNGPWNMSGPNDSTTVLIHHTTILRCIISWVGTCRQITQNKWLNLLKHLKILCGAHIASMCFVRISEQTATFAL